MYIISREETTISLHAMFVCRSVLMNAAVIRGSAVHTDTCKSTQTLNSVHDSTRGNTKRLLSILSLWAEKKELS